jgi:single-strand DNA-binding protein
MSNFNKVFLMGNLTNDPVSRTFQSGQTVTNFGMAINRNFVSNGENKRETVFVDLEAWGRQAELINTHFSKGSRIFIEGRLKLDSWENKEGQKRSKLMVTVEGIQFVGGDIKSEDAKAEDAPQKVVADTNVF